MPKQKIIILALVISCIIFFSYKSGDIGRQFTGDENFYFKSAQEMLSSGDWLTPRYYGTPRFQKPILYYWMVALSFSTFGITWFAARFPSVLAGALTVFLLYLMGSIIFKKRTLSLISALILATTFKFFKYTRFAIPDMALLLSITLSFYIILRLLQNEGNRRLLWALFFASLAVGMMIKGPIGVIIPAISIASFRFFFKERIEIKRSDIFSGILLFVIITTPWFIVMQKIHGASFLSHIWSREIAHRVGYFADTKQGFSRVTEYLGTLFFYIPVLFVRFLPWSIFLPAGIYYALSVSRSISEEKRVYGLIFSWFAATFIFFTLVGEKHSQYILTLTPPFALMIGAYFSRGVQFTRKRLILPFIIVAITVSSYLFILGNEDLRLNNAIIGEFAMEIISRDPGGQARAGMGSHELIPQQLEAYLNRPVEKVGIKWYDSTESDYVNRLRLKELFSGKGKAFCIINTEDFEKFVEPKDKTRLEIIHKDLLWKRKIRLTRDNLTLLFKGRISSFLDSFKKEYYLVTNK